MAEETKDQTDSFADDLWPVEAQQAEGDEPSQPDKAEAAAPSEETKKEPETADATKVETQPDTATKEAETKGAEKAAESPSTDWESDNNPYKKRQADTFKWGNSLSTQLANVSKQLQIQGKKIDGTFDPEVDKEPTLTPEQATAMATLDGKIAASDEVAYTNPQYGGKAKVEQVIAEFNTVYGKHEGVLKRVYSSPTPTIEALDVMAEHGFFLKYGRKPAGIIEAIGKEKEAELRKSITAEMDKKYLGRIKAKEDNVEGLNGVRTEVVQDKAPKSDDTMLNEAFPNF